MKRSFILSINKTFSALLFGAFLMLGVLRANAQMSVTATVGTTGPTVYATLGAAFTAINTGVHGGVVTITVTGSTVEPVTALLNSPALPATYTSVTIKPAAATTPTITGAIGGNAVIYLFGSSNVTIDGSNTASGTTRDLTIGNTTPGSAVTIRLSSPSTALGTINNTIMNCNITGAGIVNSGTGIVSCASGTLYGHAEGSNTGNTVQNCKFTGLQVGILVNGPEPTLTPGAVVDANWTIKDNLFQNLFFNDIIFFSAATSTISGNTIKGTAIPSPGAAGNVNGIELSWTINGCNIFNNKIDSVVNTATTVAVPAPATQGIYCDVVNAAANINIYNNFISNVFSFGYGIANIAQDGHGLYIDAGGGYNIYHNSIDLTRNPLGGAGIFAGICFNTTATGMPANSVDLRDNIIVNAQGFGSRYCVYSAYPATIFSTMDYNDYATVTPGAFLGNVGGVDCGTIAAMSTNFGGNVNSLNIAPAFVSAATGDLHLTYVLGNFPLAVGTAIATVPTDIDNANRDPATPTIGAHELINKVAYLPLPTTTCNQGDVTTLSANVLSPIGTNLSGALVPRVYFRKNTGPWFSSPGTLVAGSVPTNSNWNFTISPATMGGVIGGDVISYYVIAQTTVAVTPAVFSYPSGGLSATSVLAVTVPPAFPTPLPPLYTYTITAVAITGLTTSQNVCYNPVTFSTLSYPYTGSYGTPDQYTLSWSPAGPSDVPLYSTLGSPINVNIPPGVGPGTFTGTVTVKNSLTGCTKTSTITAIVNPPPAPIGGTNVVCIGAAITLTDASAGGGWTSVTPSIASVGPTTGIVTGHTIGTTTISYILPTGCFALVTVNVPVPPGPITGTDSLCVNTTTLLSDAPAGGAWSSTDITKATVDATGLVTGVSYGYDTIKYSITGCVTAIKRIKINDLPAPITGSFYACVGQTTTLHTTSAGGTWSSGATTIGTVGSISGIVTGVAAGAVPISYTYLTTGCIMVNTVTILTTPGPITGPLIVCQGQTVHLTNIEPGGSWTSNFPGFVSIDAATGIALGVAAGSSATITYMLPTACFKTAVVNVSTPPGASGPGIVICSGYSGNLSNSVSGGTWTSANTSIATVDPSSGVVTGMAGGIVAISYATDSCNPVTYIVTVNQTPPPITGVTNLCNGYTTTSTALSNPTLGGVWSICCGSGIITPTGLVFGLTLGSTNVVTYTMPNGCYVAAPIVVDTLPGPITGNNSICLFTSSTLHDVTVGGVWSSSNGTIVTATAATGDIYGASIGTARITYTSVSGCYVSRQVTVNTPLPSSVSFTYTPNIDPGPLCAGTPISIKAHPVNGGVLPSFRWQLFGIDIPGAVDSVYTYIPTHGDVITVLMTRDASTICSAPVDATTALAINVYPTIVNPTIHISTDTYTSPARDTAILGIDSTRVGFFGQVLTFFSEVSTAGVDVNYQWYVDGVAIAGATNSSYARETYDNDTIFCSVSGDPLCAAHFQNSSNIILVYRSWLGASSITTGGGSLALFPNPNTGVFTLSGTVGNNSTGNVSVDITNVIGQVVYNGTVPVVGGNISKQITLGKDLPSGSYLLRVNSETETQILHFIVGQ